MGRVARYKKTKKVFDVDHLFAADAERDDPVEESRKARGRLLTKFNADGTPRSPVPVRIRKRPRPESIESKFKLQKKQNDESQREFLARVERETAQELLRQRKSMSRKAAKGKAYLKKRRERERSRKLNKGQGDMTEKEHEVYFEKGKTDSVKDKKQRPKRSLNFQEVADAPPEILAATIPKKRRTRELESSFSFNSDKTPRERLEMEALRNAVLERYAKARQKHQQNLLS